jgi:large subunit ribosomal protein L19
MLRQLAQKARGVLATAGTQWAAPEAQQLTTLLSFRGLATGSRPLWEAAPSAPAAAPAAGMSPAAATTAAAAAPRAPLPPWTPTRDLPKRKTLPKRMGFMMHELEREKQAAAAAATPRPDFAPGDLLELTLSVPENRRRTTVFKGIVIAKRNRGWRTSFTLRNFIGNSGGIERTFPL